MKTPVLSGVFNIIIVKMRSLICLFAIVIFSGTAVSASVPFYLGGKNYQADVKSVKQIKEEGVVLQTDEFTCGAAALATLLRDNGDPTASEAALLSEEKELVKGKGLSVLQLKRLAENRGFKAVGYKMELANLFDFDKPMIMHVILGDEGHYYVFKGIYEDRIYLKDPAQGNIRMSLERFSRIWTGMVLALEEKDGKELTNKFDPPMIARPELIAVRMTRR